MVAIRPMAGTEARPTECNKILNSSIPKFEIVLRTPTLRAGSQFRNSKLLPYALLVLSLSKDALCPHNGRLTSLLYLSISGRM